MIEEQVIADPKPKIPRPEFAAKIKAKYPQYKHIADEELIDKIVAKYPAYADTVEPLKKKDEASPTTGIPFENQPETSLHLPGEVDLGQPLPQAQVTNQQISSHPEESQSQDEVLKNLAKEANRLGIKDKEVDKAAKEWAEKQPQKKDAGFWESLFKRGYDVFANQIPTVPAVVSMATTPKNYEGFRQQHARDIPIPGKAEFSDKKSIDFWKENISPIFKKDFDEIIARHPEGGEDAYKEFSGLVEGGLHAVTKSNISELESQQKDTEKLLENVPVHRNDAGLLDLGYIGGQLGNALATSATAITGPIGPFLLEQNDAYTSALQKAEEVTGKSKEEIVMSDMNENLAKGATIAGAINTALELTSLNVMTQPFKKLLVRKLGEEIIKRGVGNVLKETVKGTVTEGVTEGIQDLVTQISSNVSSGKKWDDVNWDSTIESVLGGVIGGGVISGASSTVSNISKSKQQDNASTVRGDQEQVPQGGNEPTSSEDQSSKNLQLDEEKGKSQGQGNASVNAPQNTGEGNLPSGEGIKIEPKHEKTKPKATGKRKRAKVPKVVKEQPAPISGEEKKEGQVPDLTPKDIHAAAKESGIDYESKDFMNKSKELTGKEHLDDMAPEELSKVKDYVQSKKTVDERDQKIKEASKPNIKLTFVSPKDLVKSSDPVGTKEKQDGIKDQYKELRKLIDCLHG